MVNLRLLAVLVLAGACTSAWAEGNPAKGREKAETCGGCHGADGNSSAPIFPKLAGQHAPYMVKQLHDFKSPKRNDPTMSALVEPLTDEDIADVAAYYSQQKTTVESPKPNADGEKLYRAGNPETGVPGCIGCHGPDAKGNPYALYPSLHGQYAAYVEKTLRDFRAAQRTNDANSVMRNIAARLTDAEIAAIADHVASLR